MGSGTTFGYPHLFCELSKFISSRSLRIRINCSGYDVVKSYQTPSPLWYPESFTRKFPRLGKMLTLTPLTMFLFAPLVGLGYVSGNSDNITMIARPGFNG